MKLHTPHQDLEVSTNARIKWRWGLLAACVLTLLSLYPQFQLWLSRGEYWQHAVAYNQGLGDEVAYAAYVNALIDGRPRRNDPYTGRDDRPFAPSPESLFSIQFVPAYAVALPARALGISATTAFMFLTPLVAFTSGMAVFLLVFLVTGSNRIAASGVLVVLCLGTLAAAEGTFSNFVGGETHFDYFPFLRRYQPAASFPLFLIFLILVWKSLTKLTRPIWSGLLVGLVLALLVFSYFYLWTAAIAWLFLLVLLWLIARPEDKNYVVRFCAAVATISVAALIPYFILISHGADTSGSVQFLVNSRRPDLFSAAELLAGLLLLILAVGIKRRSIDLHDRRVIVIISFALLPFVVLNQQLITGRVMQPIHYKGFVTSYAVLIAFVLASGLQWRRREGEHWQLSKRALVWIALAAFDWGGIEAQQAARRSAEGNNKAAEEMSVYVRFAKQAHLNTTIMDEKVVLFDDLHMADGAPAVSPLAVLWAPHMIVYSGVTQVESKERLYRHLYYTGVGVKELDAYLHGQDVYYGCAVGLFGFDRLVDGLNPNAKPITIEEKNAELISYGRYVETFDKERAANPRLSYLITQTVDGTDLRNLERWYQRDAGERVGKFTLFRLQLRDDGEGAGVSKNLALDNKNPAIAKGL
ncbi:MAG TPA: hypothetical protein VMZ30_06020 [Pyrinomonadaceae bacterium]|nr:hypothetical protein [Pyrinomonadaceae bacterium]